MERDRSLRLASFIFAAIGLLDAAYLTWVKFAHAKVICGGYGGCDTVNTSPYAEIGGIPIAILGAGAYLAILALLALEPQGGFWRSNGPLLVFGITLIGVIFSAYLTYLEVAVIHAVCFYCVISAIAMLVLFILSIIRVINPQPEVNPV